MSFEREPSRTGLGLTAAASLLGVAGTLLAGGGVALLGLPLTVGGVYRCSRRLLAVGVGALFVGVFAASTTGVAPGLVVVAMVGTLLAWDVGENAISLAEQLGGAGEHERVEIVHAATTGVVATFVATGAYMVYRLSTGGQPELALALLVIGALIGTAALQR